MRPVRHRGGNFARGQDIRPRQGDRHSLRNGQHGPRDAEAVRHAHRHTDGYDRGARRLDKRDKVIFANKTIQNSGGAAIFIAAPPIFNTVKFYIQGEFHSTLVFFICLFHYSRCHHPALACRRKFHPPFACPIIRQTHSSPFHREHLYRRLLSAFFYRADCCAKTE